MHDGISLERLGTPAVTICTEAFREAAEAQARALGMPNYPIVVIAHPLAMMSPADLECQARRAWRQAVRYLLRD